MLLGVAHSVILLLNLNLGDVSLVSMGHQHLIATCRAAHISL